MISLLKCPISNNALKCEEFNLRSKGSSSHMFAAYANQEVTDFFEFCDKEGPQHTSAEQLQLIYEIESHEPKPTLINDFDMEVIGEGLDLEAYESFKVENTLYNLKKDIKVDPLDFGQAQQASRKRDLKIKKE